MKSNILSLVEYLKANKLGINADVFIEQLLSKQYQNQHLTDILNQNARNNGELAFYVNDSK